MSQGKAKGLERAAEAVAKNKKAAAATGGGAVIGTGVATNQDRVKEAVSNTGSSGGGGGQTGGGGLEFIAEFAGAYGELAVVFIAAAVVAFIVLSVVSSDE